MSKKKKVRQSNIDDGSHTQSQVLSLQNYLYKGGKAPRDMPGLRWLPDLPTTEDRVIIDKEADKAWHSRCTCKNPPKDDGQTTCWVHHNCMWGDCTHAEED